MRAHRVHPPLLARASSAAAFALVLTGCGDPPPPAPPASDVAAVFVAPAALELRAGQAAQLAAQANDEAGRAIGGAELDFVATTPAIVDVTHQGLVSATGPVGAAEIRVLGGRAETTVPVVVRPGEPRSLIVATAEAPAGTMPEDSPRAKGSAAEARAFAVRALDAFANPVPGVVVVFRAAAGEVAGDPPTDTTDADGVARTRWTPGEAPGEYALEASVAGVPPMVDRVLRPAAADADPEPDTDPR